MALYVFAVLGASRVADTAMGQAGSIHAICSVF